MLLAKRPLKSQYVAQFCGGFVFFLTELGQLDSSFPNLGNWRWDWWLSTEDPNSTFTPCPPFFLWPLIMTIFAGQGPCSTTQIPSLSSLKTPDTRSGPHYSQSSFYRISWVKIHPHVPSTWPIPLG